MKKITAIVRPEKLEPLKDALFEAKVSGMTISQVQGCGSQHGWKEYYRGTEVLLNMVPKVKFEIICDDAEVDALIDVISATARTGNVGDGNLRLPGRRGGAHPHRRARRRGDLVFDGWLRLRCAHKELEDLPFSGAWEWEVFLCARAHRGITAIAGSFKARGALFQEMGAEMLLSSAIPDGMVVSELHKVY